MGTLRGTRDGNFDAGNIDFGLDTSAIVASNSDFVRIWYADEPPDYLVFSDVTINGNYTLLYGDGTFLTRLNVGFELDLSDNTGGADIEGGQFGDIIKTGSGDDTLNGAAGNDLLVGGGGADRLDGGAGTDTVSYSASSSGVTVDLGLGTGSGGDAAGDVYVSIESIIGSAHGDMLIGNDVPNRIDAGGGNDTLVGAWYIDTLDGGSGNDVFRVLEIDFVDEVNGGSGDDTLDLSAVLTNSSNVDLGAGTHYGWGAGIEPVATIDIENFIGGQMADQITGSAGANRLDGQGGDDVIAGGLGSDTLDGGGGNDTLDGGANADSLLGGNDDDSLLGGASQDTIDGGAGNDTIDGGAGSDTLLGGSGIDTVDYSGFPGAATVNLSVTTPQSTGTGGIDMIGGFENVNGAGGADNLVGTTAANVMRGNGGNDAISGIGGADQLIGDGGNDNINGGNGNDTITGGLGRDVLTGGNNADMFVYIALADSPSGAARDLIRDFVQGTDLIDLAAIDAVPATGPNNAFAFIGVAAFSGAAGELRYAASGSATVVSADTNGDAAADFQIQLSGLHALLATDFLL